MTLTAFHSGQPALVPSPNQRELGKRIRWICQALRIAALLWIAWALVFAIYQWGNKEWVLKNIERVLSVDLANVSDARYAIAFAAAMVSVAMMGVVVVCLWQLAGTYLVGRVFTVEAALWLRRTALALIAAALVGVLMRVMAYSILTGRVLPGAGYYFLPGDLFRVMLGSFLLALA